MVKRRNHLTFEDHGRRISAQSDLIKAWVLGPDSPDPAYDPLNGWKLDQFAMHFMPHLVRQYKRVLAEGHPHNNSMDPIVLTTPFEWLVWRYKLEIGVIRRLLDTRFRVEGYKLQGFKPKVIPIALLERMRPRIETSELWETDVPGETARRFEHVRVFDLAPTAKPRGGRKPTYDWPRLAEQLEREKPVFANMPALVAYCGDNVKIMPGKKAGRDGPDDKTIRAAISEFGWEKFIKPVQ